MLTRGGICVPPTVNYLPYRVSRPTLTAVGRSQLLARWPGTHCRILSGIQRAAKTVFGVYLKRTCSRDTSASSALGVLNDYAPYKCTHSLTHSLMQAASIMHELIIDEVRQFNPPAVCPSKPLRKIHVKCLVSTRLWACVCISCTRAMY